MHLPTLCRNIAIAAATSVLSVLPAAAQTSPYAGQQDREIKSLSAEELRDLAEGRGMGMAKAAELNHYPGPAHVIELKDKLELSPAQLSALEAAFARMSGAAKPLGTELIERERQLERTFRDGSADAGAIAAATAEIGAFQGRLRAVHLAAHVETRAILTPAQLAAYDRLRGYDKTGPAPAGTGHHPGLHKG
jgi:hypothetical protein